MSRRQSWLAALAGGVAGTAAMTLSLDLHAKLRPNAQDGLIDYDASDHVVIAASKVVHWNPTSRRQRAVLFDIVHWGYGSAVAIEYDELRRRLDSEPKAALAFYAACQSMAFALFPLLGETPPPWRWSRGVLASSMAEHALYVATVAVVSRGVRDRFDHPHP
jgi:uncharacterized membrane protein YagU involved in acid resistance